MNTNYYRDIIDVPSKGEITAMENVFTKMEKSGNEEGYVAGVPKGGGEKKINDSHSGTSNHGFEPQPGYEDLKEEGASGSYDAHSHPPVLIYDSELDRILLSSPKSSVDDRETTSPYEEAYGRTQANITLGYDTPSTYTEGEMINAKSNPDEYVPRAGNFAKVINFYNGKGNIATFKFSSFKKAADKAQSHNQLRCSCTAALYLLLHILGLCEV